MSRISIEFEKIFRKNNEFWYVKILDYDTLYVLKECKLLERRKLN